MNTISRRTAAAVLAAALPAAFLFPFGQAAASSVVRPHSSPGLTVAHNPLMLTSPRNHTRAVMLPTTAWIQAHAREIGWQGSTQAAMSASTPSGSGLLPPPACTLATDSSNSDASATVPGVGAEGPFPSLDISASGFATVKGNLKAQLKVVSLTSSAGQPDVPSGQVDNWFAQWNYTTGGTTTTYYLRAQYAGGDATTTTQYTYGTVQVVGGLETLHVPSGTASGSMDLKNNIVTISVPLASVGSPKNGQKLTNELWETDVQVGSPLYTTDTQPSSAPGASSSKAAYAVGETGKTCPPLLANATGTSGAVPTAGNPSNLTHYGGSIVHTMKNYLIFWLPQQGASSDPGGKPCVEGGPAQNPISYNYEPTGFGSGSDANYEGILAQYFRDLDGSGFYNLLTQYADNTSGAVVNNEQLAGVVIDHCGYTSTPQSGVTVPGGTAANPIYDEDIQMEVQRMMSENAKHGWTSGLDHQYFVFLGNGAASCFSPPSPGSPEPVCNTSGVVPTFCAYHGDFIDKGAPVLYANMADAAFASVPPGVTDTGLCYSAPIGSGKAPRHTFLVNGRKTSTTDYVADAEVSVTSHEEFETVSDSMVGTAPGYGPPLGWYSSPSSQASGEIGDKCAYVYGAVNGSDGSNIVLHGQHYIVQQEWSNWNNGCALANGYPNPKLASGQTQTGFGGAPPTVRLEQGWNIISDPTTSRIPTAELLEDAFESQARVPEDGILSVATYHGGQWTLSIPDFTDPREQIRTNDGIYVNVAKPFNWTPPGAVVSSPSVIHLNPGWNLIGARFPDPGIMTDSMFNQIEAESHACTEGHGGLNATTVSCKPTVSEIAAMAGGKYLDWKPLFDKKGNVTYPLPVGNQVPFTNGMWVHSTRPLNWRPQGTACAAVDSSGQCR
ncbi:MAG TPA: hypothetical protein VFB34_13490 [Chloroflexota bacterium]|nr:hypothetical protein [Chloroflexota bacterium]